MNAIGILMTSTDPRLLHLLVTASVEAALEAVDAGRLTLDDTDEFAPLHVQRMAAALYESGHDGNGVVAVTLEDIGRIARETLDDVLRERGR